MTYLEAYESGCNALSAAGVPEYKLEARYLLEYCCKTSYHTLLAHGDKVLTSGEEEDFRSLLERRVRRIPLAYLTGTQAFMGLDFTVSEAVLIPEQDTETLVEEALRFLFDGNRILDLCTGSGCIALSLLSYSNETTALGTDLSEEALKVARKNAKKLNLSDRFQAVKADLFPEKKEKFDMVLSNPPYIPAQVLRTLEPEVKDHEPSMALDGGEDGLVFYRRIVKDIRPFLTVGGRLFLEIGYDQARAVSALMEEAGFLDVKIIKDLGGNDRVAEGYLKRE